MMKLIKKISLIAGFAVFATIAILVIYYICIMYKYANGVANGIKEEKEIATSFFREMSFDGIVSEIDKNTITINTKNMSDRYLPMEYIPPYDTYDDTTLILRRCKDIHINKIRKGVLVSKKKNTEVLLLSGDTISIYEILDF